MIKIGDSPKCVFCDDRLHDAGGAISSMSGPDRQKNRFYFECINESCLVFRDFQRYKIAVDGYGYLVAQEYAITDQCYVKVFKDTSLIYQLQGCMLMDEIRIPRALWLDSTNIPQTLDKLKLMITFS